MIESQLGILCLVRPLFLQVCAIAVLYRVGHTVTWDRNLEEGLPHCGDVHPLNSVGLQRQIL